LVARSCVLLVAIIWSPDIAAGHSAQAHWPTYIPRNLILDPPFEGMASYAAYAKVRRTTGSVTQLTTQGASRGNRHGRPSLQPERPKHTLRHTTILEC
jgi:hypothetical protein